MHKIKEMREDVLKNTTLPILDEYLYQINLYLDYLQDCRNDWNNKNQDYNLKFETRVKELMETENDKWKLNSKTASETIAWLDYNDLLQEVKEAKREMENAETEYKQAIINYHHWKAKLKWDFEIDVQANDFDNLSDDWSPF